MTNWKSQGHPFHRKPAAGPNNQTGLTSITYTTERDALKGKVYSQKEGAVTTRKVIATSPSPARSCAGEEDELRDASI